MSQKQKTVAKYTHNEYKIAANTNVIWTKFKHTYTQMVSWLKMKIDFNENTTWISCKNHCK